MDDNHKLTLGDLTPADYNPREISDVAASGLAKSIESFGDISGIVYNERTGNLVSGHQRVAQLRKLGAQMLGCKLVATVLGERREFAVRVVDWTEGQEKAANVAANNHHIGGAFTDGLADILAEVQCDIGDLAFEELRLDELLEDAPDADITEDEGAGGPPEDPATQPGDLWLLGDHRLVCGDSTDADTVKRLLAGASPHLMVTDPPYGVEYDADWRNKAMRSDGTPDGGRAVGKVENDDRADWTEAWELFQGDVAYVWHAGKFSAVVSDSLVAAGMEIRQQIIWAKQHLAIGRSDYHWKHEPCWYAVRKGKTGHWAGDRKQTTLWEIDKPQKSETGHSTQKPIECMARPIRNNSRKGDAVYDPFLGSGTTLIAGEQLGRKVYGCELSPAYCDVIVQRWEKLTGREATREAL